MYNGGGMERPVCASPGCSNMAERYGGGQKEMFRKLCNSCRKTKAGRPRGGWQRARAHRQEVQARGACEGCGAVNTIKGFFDIHHRDGNASNDAIENLALLCPSCHREAHLGVALGTHRC